MLCGILVKHLEYLEISLTNLCCKNIYNTYDLMSVLKQKTFSLHICWQVSIIIFVEKQLRSPVVN